MTIDALWNRENYRVDADVTCQVTLISEDRLHASIWKGVHVSCSFLRQLRALPRVSFLASARAEELISTQPLRLPEKKLGTKKALWTCADAADLPPCE